MTDSHEILYVAGDADAAREGAAALSNAAPSLSAAPTASVATVRDRGPGVDCVVFAETPTTPEGAHLLEVADAAGETPLVLFSDASYAPTAARSTDGIDGYVRRDSPSAFAHLADEVRWRCHGTDTGGREAPSEDSKIARLHEMATRIVACREERRLFDLAIETAEGVLAFDATSIMTRERRDDGAWLVPRAAGTGASTGNAREMRPDEGLAGKTFRSGRSFRVDDLREDGDARPADESFRSAISVPIGDRGVFQAVAEEPAGFDDGDVELAEILASHVGETLRRIRVERRLRDRRERATRLHEGAVRFAAAGGREEVCDLAVEVAGTVLEFDACRLFLRGEDRGTLAVAASSTDGECDPGEWSVAAAAESRRRGESILENDLREAADAPDNEVAFGSAITVPIGDRGAFQALAERPGAFEEGDLELSELLVSHVDEALARLEVERDLLAERDRLSALFDNLPDPAVRCEFVDGAIVVRDANRAFESTFGFDRETILGADVDDYLVPAEYEEEARRLNETIGRGEPFQRTTRRLTADEVKDVRITLVPVELGERSPEGFGIYTDVTEQKRRERELASRNERLDEFASIVSHDLQSPLNVARGYLELAEETGDPEHFEEVERAHERMKTLIERLLTLARHGELIAETEPVAVHEVARRAWAAVDADDASLELDRDGILEADETRLRELLDNLVRNAVEHGGDGPLTVRIGATDDGFYVADDGVGVPEDRRDEIFESGYTTAEEGTGYGLAIVYRIADAHGWTVSVGESAGGGARFEVRGADVGWLGADREPEADV